MFLGIEIINTSIGVCLRQIKYTFELLHEYGLLGCKPTNVHLNLSTIINNKSVDDNDELLYNFTGNQQLIGKLIYLSFAIQTLSHFM